MRANEVVPEGVGNGLQRGVYLQFPEEVLDVLSGRSRADDQGTGYGRGIGTLHEKAQSLSLPGGKRLMGCR